MHVRIAMKIVICGYRDFSPYTLFLLKFHVLCTFFFNINKMCMMEFGLLSQGHADWIFTTDNI